MVMVFAAADSMLSDPGKMYKLRLKLCVFRNPIRGNTLQRESQETCEPV